MKQEKREEVLKSAAEMVAKLKDTLDYRTQKIDNISYFEEFEFEGSGLGEKQIYIVKIQNREVEKQDDIDNEKVHDKAEKPQLKEYSTYEIYDKDQNLIATVGENGKVQFEPEYLQALREINPEFYETLQLNDLDFKLPEKLKENDMIMTEEDLKDAYEKQQRENSSKKIEDKKEEQGIESETKEEGKAKTAEALGIKPEELRGLSQINPNEKITDEYNMRDLIPETKEYDRIEIACAKGDNKQGDARFTILGIKKDGTRQVLNSIGAIEGVSTSKKVIAINEDGSQVQEKSVQGLLRINSRNREDGIALSLGNYNVLEISYVRNIMDKESRRSTPIKTLDSENRKYPTHEVRENAGDSIEEVEQESTRYRENQEEGIDPQSLDGIEQDNNIEFIKQRIISDAIEEGEMSGQQLKEYAEKRIEEINLSLTDAERQNVVNDIVERTIDESRFPIRGLRRTNG